MTADLVDGEVVELTPDEATAITSRIRLWVKAFPADDVKRAYFGRIWIHMGYDSWAEWCDCEFDVFTLPALERREAVAELAESGMSETAIADVIHISRNTVRKDKAWQGVQSEQPVTGRDGKAYTKPKPKAEDGRTDPATGYNDKQLAAIRDWGRRNGWLPPKGFEVTQEVIRAFEDACGMDGEERANLDAQQSLPQKSGPGPNHLKTLTNIVNSLSGIALALGDIEEPKVDAESATKLAGELEDNLKPIRRMVTLLKRRAVPQ